MINKKFFIYNLNQLINHKSTFLFVETYDFFTGNTIIMQENYEENKIYLLLIRLNLKNFVFIII